jgi:putative aldouronate transport system substrate-binding protein
MQVPWRRAGLALVLSLSLTVGAFAADPPVTISVFQLENFPAPAKDNRMYKLIQDRLGVTFTWDIAVGNIDQKVGVMIASQDYTDILTVNSNKFIEAGALLPLEDLIEKYAPNLKRHYQSDPIVWKKMHEKDGHVYTLVNYGVVENGATGTDYYGPAMFIQKAVMKEAGYPKIKTIDEYFDLIAKYKAKHPTTADGKPTIGFSILTYDWHVFDLINPPLFLAGFPNDGNGFVDPKTYKYKVGLDSSYAKRWYKLLSEKNAKGLVDRESFIDNYDQYQAKLTNGQVLGIHDQYWQFQDSQKPLISSDQVEKTMMPMPIVFEKNIKPWWRDSVLPNLQRGYGISVKTPMDKAIRIIKFLDAQLSEEWQRLLQWGIEGQDYTVNAKGLPVRTETQRAQQRDPTWRLQNMAELWWSDAPKLEGHYTNGANAAIQDNPTEFLPSQKPLDVEIYKAYGVGNWSEMVDKNPPVNPPWYPAWQITPPDGSPAQLAWKKAEDTYKKFLPKIILGTPAEFEANWKEYTDALAKCNLKAYEDFVQAGINDRIAKYGKK